MRCRLISLLGAILFVVLSFVSFRLSVATAAVVVWGDDSNQIQSLPSPNYGFCAVSARDWCVLALKSSGSLVKWGGTCNPLPLPNGGFIAVANGGSHALALEVDGSILGWGANDYGQRDVPEPNLGFTAVDANFYHSIALKADGTVVAWGRNDYGQCEVPEPTAGFIAVAAGGQHSLGLRIDGSLVAWGQNTYGQCDLPEPNTGFVAISAGSWHNLAIRNDGTLVAWGRNTWGQSDPPPEPNADFVAVSAGNSHSLALRSDGTVVAWGLNTYGQCDVPPGYSFEAISAGPTYSVGLSSAALGACCLPSGSCQMRIVEMCPGPAVWGGLHSYCVPGPCDVADVTPEVPLAAPLLCTPNPSSGPVTIHLGRLTRTGARVTARICDPSGRVIRTIHAEAPLSDNTPLEWDGLDGHGRLALSGYYIVQIIRGAEQQTGSVVLLR